MTAGVLLMLMVCLSDRKVTGCSVGPVITVSKLSKASVSCPFIVANSSVLKYVLLFNDSCISEIHLNKQWDSPQSLFYGHFEVTAYNSGVYICKREVIYPPPSRADCLTTEVIVAEKQSLLTINDSVPVANQRCPVKSPVIPEEVMWSVCGVLSVYSLSVTCIIIWSKLKRDEEDANVYVNTRPGELRKPCKI